MLTLGSTQPGQLRLLPSVWVKWDGGAVGGEGVQNGGRKGETEPLLGTFKNILECDFQHILLCSNFSYKFSSFFFPF